MGVTLRHSKGVRKAPHTCFEGLSMTPLFYFFFRVDARMMSCGLMLITFGVTTTS
jgi:hypothetical protein